MNRFHLTLCSTLVAVFFLTTGCANSPSEGTLPATHGFDLSLGETTVTVQLAVTPEETRQGLMNRTELGTNEGMLFIFTRPQQASFWMRNTSLPLDIGFFNEEGRLLEVYPLYPYDESSVRSRSHEILISLEMNQGWFSRNRVRPGATLDLDELREALRARGFNPVDYRL